MKTLYLVIALFLALSFFGCQETNQKPYIMGKSTSSANPNSMANIAKEKADDRANLIALKEIETKANIEITKIQSQKDLEIAKIDSHTKKDIASSNIKVKQENSDKTFYISIAFLFVLVIALLIWYLNSKKNRELQAKLQQQKLDSDLAIKAKELEEQRLNKLLELLEKGKLPEDVESKIIKTITDPKLGYIEHK